MQLNRNISFSDLLSMAADIFKKIFLPVFPIYFIFSVIPGLIANMNPKQPSAILTLVSSLLGLVVSGVVFFYVYSLVKGEKTTFSDSLRKTFLSAPAVLSSLLVGFFIILAAVIAIMLICIAVICAVGLVMQLGGAGDILGGSLKQNPTFGAIAILIVAVMFLISIYFALRISFFVDFCFYDDSHWFSSIKKSWKLTSGRMSLVVGAYLLIVLPAIITALAMRQSYLYWVFMTVVFSLFYFYIALVQRAIFFNLLQENK
ncbi:hypothetical protein Dip510_001090 [Elusimicrobium posterum]|uniref:hypothetical protein n=1 Tax=Elusimicrobium posterum TaxID=3116653 RepID=UPI003C708F84